MTVSENKGHVFRIGHNTHLYFTQFYRECKQEVQKIKKDGINSVKNIDLTEFIVGRKYFFPTAAS